MIDNPGYVDRVGVFLARCVTAEPKLAAPPHATHSTRLAPPSGSYHAPNRTVPEIAIWRER